MYRKLKSRLIRRSEPQFNQVVASLRPGDIAVDLGAHVGTFTRRMAATGATIHAFEPDPIAFGILRDNVAGLPNVVVHNAAVAGRDGTAVLYRPRTWRPGSPSRANSIARIDYTMNLDEGLPVQLVDFADFLVQLPKPVRLVKVDIEGAEWELLRAVIDRALDRFEAMFVETHERFDLSILPEARRLQQFAANLERPYINLYWG